MLAKLRFNTVFGLATLIFITFFPLFASDFRVELMGKFLAFVLFAISLDLIWGYTGLLSLGHSVFFGLGGYILAISYSVQNGIPSYMSRFGIEQLPALLRPLESIPAAILLGLVVPAVLAGLIGYFIFKSRVSGVYFSIITLALAKLFEMLMINNQAYTGGFNGLMGLPRFPINGEPMSLLGYYYFMLIIVMLAYILTRWLTQSHFGKVMMSIRENESRTTFLSYNTSTYKIFIYVVSGLLAGLAGILYVPINGFISPQDAGNSISTMLVIWLALGGRGKLMGAVFGTLAVNWLSNLLSEQYPQLWQLILGVIMVLIVLYLPNGLYGTLEDWLASRRQQKEAKAGGARAVMLKPEIRKGEEV